MARIARLDGSVEDELCVTVVRDGDDNDGRVTEVNRRRLSSSCHISSSVRNSISCSLGQVSC